MLIAIVNSPEGEQTSEFEDEPIVMGRHGRLRIPDRRVSKQHARLQRADGEWYVEDMGSTNGTFVNGTRVLRPFRVKEGDKLKLGSTVVVLSKLGDTAQRASVPPPPFVPAQVAPPPMARRRLERQHVEQTAIAPSSTERPPVAKHVEQITPEPLTAPAPAAAEAGIEPVAQPVADVAAAAAATEHADERHTPAAPVAHDVTSLAPAPTPEYDGVLASSDSTDDDVPAFIDAAPATFVYTGPADLVDTAPATFDDVAFSPFLNNPDTITSLDLEPSSDAEAAPLAADDTDASVAATDPPRDGSHEADLVSIASDEPAPATSGVTDVDVIDVPAADRADPDASAERDDRSDATAVGEPLAAAPQVDVPETTEPSEPPPSLAVDEAPVPTAVAEEPAPPQRDESARAQREEPAAPADEPAADEPAADEPAADEPAAEPADPADDDPLDPWVSELPARRRPQHLRHASDEAILFSIRPLAQRDADDDDAATPRWRRMLPMSILALVLFVVAANLVVLALFRREARRDARELREAIAKQDQVNANLIVRELREELRAPSPQQLQAMQDLGDGLLNRQAVLTEKLQAELAAQRQAGAAQTAARSKEDAEAAQASQASLLRELAEIKQAISGLQQPASPAQAPSSPPRQAAATAGPDAPSSQAPDTGVPVPPVPPASASPAAGSPAVVADAKAPPRTFLIDASAALEHAIPQAVAEVRRAIDSSRRRGPVRILLLYQGRLIELPQAALDSRDVDPIDRGAADLPAALKAALADRPPTLYLLSDTLGDLEASLRAIRAGDANQTTIHVVQFFSRDRREQLKALAREYHGDYSYIAPAR